MMMALGDALAVALLERVGFSREDFELRHPGGQLGHRLVKVERLMHKGERIPLARPDTAMADALLIMTSHSFGCIGLVDGAHRLVGVITDGDLRRHMGESLLRLTAADVMTARPRTVPPDALADEALRVDEREQHHQPVRRRRRPPGGHPSHPRLPARGRRLSEPGMAPIAPTRIERGYSRFVAVMKVALPLGAVAVIGLLFTWSRLYDMPERLQIGATSFSVQDSASGHRMINARYSGTDRNDNPYTLAAESIVQQRSDFDRVALNRPEADFTTADGTWVAVAAARGAFARAARQVTLQGDVSPVPRLGLPVPHRGGDDRFRRGDRLGRRAGERPGSVGRHGGRRVSASAATRAGWSSPARPGWCCIPTPRTGGNEGPPGARRPALRRHRRTPGPVADRWAAVPRRLRADRAHRRRRHRMAAEGEDLRCARQCPRPAGRRDPARRTCSPRITATARTAAPRSGGIVAEGDVRIAGPDRRATGQRGTYDVDEKLLMLTGKPVFESGEERITAERSLEYSRSRGFAVARGKAVAVRNDRTLKAETLTATFEPDGEDGDRVSRIEAVENVVFTSPNEVLRADRAIYDVAAERLSLEGSVQIIQGRNRLTGQAADIDLKSGVSRLQGGPGGVKGTFVPNTVSLPDGERER